MRAANIICRLLFWYSWRIITILRPIICSAARITPRRRSRRGAHRAPDGCSLPKWAEFAPARRGRARGRKPIWFPPSCQSPTFPLGRASRARYVTPKFPPPIYPKQQEGRLPPLGDTPFNPSQGRALRARSLGVAAVLLTLSDQPGGNRKEGLIFARAARPEGGGGDSQEAGGTLVPPPLVCLRRIAANMPL